MLQRVKELKGYKLGARDGEIGKISEFYFDDRSWTVRYLVADTGNWLTGRQVLISPFLLDPAIKDDKALPVNLTRFQIENSPSLYTDVPVSRQAEVGIAVNTATDVAKGAASVVLTQAGLTNIVTVVEQGRIIYQRILTWIINKISRTILKAAFVAIAFAVTGKFVISALAMLLLVFMTDFAKISLATDHVRSSKKPETWKIGGFITVSAALGIAMVIEALLFLLFEWSRFGLANDDNALHTFSFLLLLYFAVFSVISARARRSFWASMPGKTLMAALAADASVGTILTLIGIPSLSSLPWLQTLSIFGYAALACLIVNDLIKVLLIKRCVPAAVA